MSQATVFRCNVWCQGRPTGAIPRHDRDDVTWLTGRCASQSFASRGTPRVLLGGWLSSHDRQRRCEQQRRYEPQHASNVVQRAPGQQQGAAFRPCLMRPNGLEALVRRHDTQERAGLVRDENKASRDPWPFARAIPRRNASLPEQDLWKRLSTTCGSPVDDERCHAGHCRATFPIRRHATRGTDRRTGQKIGAPACLRWRRMQH